jgi:hypothetical protein
LVFADPFISIALALSISVGLYESILDITCITTARIKAIEATNNGWTRIFNAFSVFKVMIGLTLGASINIASKTFPEIFIAKSTARSF